MCGEIEVGTCEICGRKNVQLNRKTYEYDIPCECHSDEHKILIRYCNECKPKEPELTRITVKTEDLKDLRKLGQKLIDFANRK